jgi:diguanylate cyclase (GGDEF)-like protein
MTVRLPLPRSRVDDRAGPDGSRPRAEIDALHETAVLVAERQDTPKLLRLILTRAVSLVSNADGYLYLLEPDGRTLTLEVGSGRFSPKVGFKLQVGEGLAGRVVATGEPLAVASYERWDGHAPGLDATGLQSAVAVPLHGGAGTLGAIGLARTANGSTFGEEEIALLDRFGRLAAIALDNARLHESAQAELAERRRTEEELLDTVSRLSRSELDLRQAQAETIRRLADAAEYRDAETGRHTERMARMCEQIARRLGLDEERCQLLRDASPLHDIGKIAIPDDILLKPDAFTRQEREVMQRHAEIGHRLLSGSASEVLDLAATIALTHHERWDGSGYPHGLAGEEIPLEGRIATVADVFDALTADRVYRSALSAEEALAMMREQRGKQFDPLVFDTLEAILVTGEPRDLPLDDETAPDAGGEPDRARPDDAGEHAHGTRSRGAVSERAFRRACRAAERPLTSVGGREALERVLDLLCAPFDGRVLASIYAMEHDRLWLVAQQGYTDVRDGFALEHGVMGRAARTGSIQLVADVASEPEIAGRTPGITSEVAVPFQLGGEVVGVLCVESIGVRLPLSAGGSLAPLAALLAERVSRLKDGGDSDLGEVLRLCVHASSLRGVNAIAELAVRTVGRTLGLSSAQLDLWRPEGTGPRLLAFWRRPDFELEPLGEEALRRLDRSVDVQVASSLVTPAQAGLQEPGTPGLVVLPLRVGGSAVGLMVGRLGSVAPAQERLEAATLFAQHAAALIDVATALRREQRAAVTDQLTGLLNRRGFEERFQDELQRAARDDVPVSVVLCDCDGLKTMNDQRGHETGDALLQLIASCLRTHKRASDLAARLGGDEFGLLLPDADIETALAVAERIRTAIADETIAGFRPSASFGVASFPLHGRTTLELLRLADDALYRAKQRGGDEIISFRGVEPVLG